MKTAEEFVKQFRKDNPIAEAQSIEHWIAQHCIEFTKRHVQEALKAASENAQMSVQPSDMEEWEVVPKEITRKDVDDEEAGCEDFWISINKDSILNAYPLTNIK